MVLTAGARKNKGGANTPFTPSLVLALVVDRVDILQLAALFPLLPIPYIVSNHTNQNLKSFLTQNGNLFPLLPIPYIVLNQKSKWMTYSYNQKPYSFYYLFVSNQN